jgi:glycosyltransferase involved in cell wall biosynthesis
MIIISPEFPPARGGVADHTEQLALGLSARHSVKVLTRPGRVRGAGYEVLGQVTNWHDAPALFRAIQEADPNGPILWQYVPHMYGRGGMNRAVPQVMAGLLERGRQQLVIAHEIAAPFSFWPHRFLYALAHRRQWQQIIHWADVVAISTEAWVEEWRARVPSCAGKFHLLASPTSLPVVPVAADHRARWRERNALPAHARVIAYFGALSSAKQLEWVVAAWKRAQTEEIPVALVIVGGKPVWQLAPELRSLFRPLGYLPPADVSAVLQAADVLALPFVDGVSERRTSFMAGLAHGCPVVTTFGPNTGPGLRRADFFLGAPADNQGAFVELTARLLEDEAKRRELGHRSPDAYERIFAWPVAVRSLEAWLEGTQKVVRP